MKNIWLNKISNIDSACKKIRTYLSNWYEENKGKLKGSYAFGNALGDAKQEFIKQNPDYKKYDFDIIIGLDVDGSTWRPGCLEGCCQTRAKVRGVLVMPVDWVRVRQLAGLKG